MTGHYLMTKTKLLAVCLLMTVGGSCAFAQKVALKSNLLSDSFLSPNLGIDVYLLPRVTIFI